MRMRETACMRMGARRAMAHAMRMRARAPRVRPRAAGRPRGDDRARAR